MSENIRYTQQHHWVRKQSNIVVVGVTNYALEEVSKINFIELPEKGADVEQMSEIGEIESTKKVVNIYSPTDGVVIEVNDEIVNNPDLMGDENEEDNWLVKIQMSDENQFEELLSVDEYQNFLETLIIEPEEE